MSVNISLTSTVALTGDVIFSYCVEQMYTQETSYPPSKFTSPNGSDFKPIVLLQEACLLNQ